MSAGHKELQAAEGRSFTAAIFLSPLVWGGALTVGFYALIPHLAVEQELTRRYFCGHPIEYATTALFFIALTMLAFKSVCFRRERAVLADDSLLPDDSAGSFAKPVDKAAQLQERLMALRPSVRRTQLVQRLRDACLHVRSQQSAERLEEHMKYLAELAAEQLHGSYALVRTITWAIPILGFLGTVVGITFAVANITPEQLDTSLSVVTGGLAVAFDTTALSLGLSLVLVFCTFVVERSEQRILSAVEEYGVRRIGALFPAGSAIPTTFAAAEAEASRNLLNRTEALITWQTTLWQENLDSLRRRWMETLATGQEELDRTLRQGFAATLENHTDQLGTIRTEMLESFQDAAKALVGVVSEQQHELRGHLNEFAGQLGELWAKVHADASARQAEGLSRIEHACESVSSSARSWQSGLDTAALTAAEQLQELSRQRELMAEVVGGGRQLSELEDRLSANLEAVRATDTFEKTLHALSAAVNLLASRSHLKAA